MACLKKVFNALWRVKSIVLIIYAIFTMAMAVNIGFSTKENAQLSLTKFSKIWPDDVIPKKYLGSGSASSSSSSSSSARRLLSSMSEVRRYLATDSSSSASSTSATSSSTAVAAGEEAQCGVKGFGNVTWTCTTEVGKVAWFAYSLAAGVALPAMLLAIYFLHHSGALYNEFGSFKYVIGLVEIRKSYYYKLLVKVGMFFIVGFFAGMIATEMGDGAGSSLIINILVQNTLTILIAWGELWSPNEDVLNLVSITSEEVYQMCFNFSLFSSAENCMELIEDGLLCVWLYNDYEPLSELGLTKEQVELLLKTMRAIPRDNLTSLTSGPGDDKLPVTIPDSNVHADISE